MASWFEGFETIKFSEFIIHRVSMRYMGLAQEFLPLIFHKDIGKCICLLRQRRELCKPCQVGGPAPNSKVHSYPGKKVMGLLDAIDKSR